VSQDYSIATVWRIPVENVACAEKEKR
jgi:hypothetical protein